MSDSPSQPPDTQIERAAALLRCASAVVVLTGAGVSAESGLPTFRGADGLWRGLDPASLATPQAFARDPRLVWEFYHWRRGLVRRARPNPAHTALVELARVMPAFTLITQNVDRLHHLAGSSGVIELHGNLAEVRCTTCGQTTDCGRVALPELPTCERCDGLVRPAVVWFGEPLPMKAWSAARQAAERAGVMLVIGTSAVVYPAAGLVQIAQSCAARIIEINLEPTELGGSVEVGLYGPAGQVLPKLVAAVQRRR